jgi:hypothetical protein
MLKSSLVSLVLFFAFGATVMAHSVNFETALYSPVVTVKAYFSRNAPLKNASVVIFAPDGQQPFQSGRTDTEGYFAFVPNIAGDWTVNVDDEAGHAGKVIISVPDDFFTKEGFVESRRTVEQQGLVGEDYHHHVHDHHIPIVYRIVFGLSLIIGISGFFYGIKAGQALNNKSREN